MTDIETYYLIDYENVHGIGLSGCEELGKTDHIIIFFTVNAKNIDMSIIANHGEAELVMKQVPAGSQSVDMHICSYLGFLAGRNEHNCRVLIISKDAGFDKNMVFWEKEFGIKSARIPQINAKDTVKPQRKCEQSKAAQASTKTNERTEKNTEIQGILGKAKFHNSTISFVASTVVKDIGKKNGKQQIYRTIISEYGQKKGLEIYRQIKKSI